MICMEIPNHQVSLELLSEKTDFIEVPFSDSNFCWYSISDGFNLLGLSSFQLNIILPSSTRQTPGHDLNNHHIYRIFS